jgi:predicted Zn-dependent peptidase
MDLIDEGTDTMDSLQINEQLQLLGATIEAGSGLDRSFVQLKTLKRSFESSLAMFAEIILHPSFPEKEIKRLKREQIVSIQREKATPLQMALRIMPGYLYGPDHAYSLPMTGSGFESTVLAVGREEIQKFHDQWVLPNNSTLIVVRDLKMEDLVEKLETYLGAWKPGKAGTKEIARVGEQDGNVLYLMDRPGSSQSVVLAGYLIQPYGQVSEIAREAVNNVLGGQFISRINLNLREDKHWTYGASTFIQNTKGQRPLIAYAPVQIDKTADAIREIINEFRLIIDEKPVTMEEFDKNQNNSILKLAGKWETNAAVAGAIGEIVNHGLADDYHQTYGDKVRMLQIDEVHALSKEIVRPDKLNWFIVGDKQKIMPDLRAFGFDNILEIDSDGNVVKDN